MAQNMYRVGDYVYFEISSAAPFQVRRIEELNKTSTGNVEAKVMCFYRRRDISPALLKIADQLPPEKGEKEKAPTENGAGEGVVEDGALSNGTKREDRDDSASPAPMQVDESTADKEEPPTKPKIEKEKETDGTAGLPTGADRIDGRERHRLRQRELFLSRQIETLPATHIRGKCVVTLLNEVETPDSYLTRDDAFFYSLVYDPSAKTLLADKGEIKVGSKFQADTSQSELLAEEPRLTDRPDPMETLVFHPNHSLTDRDIDQFLIVARAVGTFSRALDTSSSVKLPSLHMTAAAASRDVTLLHAMALLHHANYDLGQAMKYLVPPPSKLHYPLDADKTTSHNTVSLGGPILCRDQMEEWSAAEANLFEEAIEKYGKDFNDIRQDFLPWKALKDIVEYYYMWKTTDRYVQSKRVKAAEAESRLKQVYIPNYNKPNPNLVGPPNPTGQPVKGTSPCESCETDMSPQWYAWGPAQMQMRLCADCWTAWKKNGGLKREHECETYDKTGAGSKPVGGTDFVQNATGITRGTTLPNQQSHPRSAFGGQQTGKSGATSGRLGQGPMGGPGGPKTRVAFFLHTTLMTRVARRLASRSLFNVRKSARKPFLPINAQAIKQNCQSRDPKEILKVAKQIKGGRLPQGMIDALSGSRPVPVPVATATAAAATTATTGSVTLKRPVSNGDSKSTPQPPAKAPRQLQAATPVAVAQQQMYMRWMALTEDVLYLANRSVKRIRRTLTSRQMRKVARGPCKTNTAVTKLLPSVGFVLPASTNNNVVVVE